MRLEKGGSITGVVREGRESRPVAGARVSVSRPARDRRLGGRSDPQRDYDGREVASASTGSAGAPWGSSRARRGSTQAREEARAGETVELFLFPGATLAGTVRTTTVVR